MARRNRDALVLVAIGAAVFFFVVPALAKGKKHVTMPTGPKVDRKQTGGASASDWARSRFAAALAEVKRRSGEDVDDATASQIALSVLTHWSIETANGAGEFNFNVGNINAGGAQSWYPIKDIDGTIHPQRSFDTLSDGVTAYFDLIDSTRYKAAAYALASKPADSDWYVALGHAGWFDPTKAKPPVSWDAAAAAFTARRASLAQYAPAVSGQDLAEGFDVDGPTPDVSGDTFEICDDDETTGEGEQ